MTVNVCNLKKGQRDYSISFVRFIAMCFIVICHIMQRDNIATQVAGVRIEWAYWFNIGVQMFLFISGYLYGRKENIKPFLFYINSIMKIMVDYYIFILIMIVVMWCSSIVEITTGDILKMLMALGTVSGLEHLWFIPTILFCYLLTPFLIKILNIIDNGNSFFYWVKSILFCILFYIFLDMVVGIFTPEWVICYVLGLLYSRIEKRTYINRQIFTSIVVCFCLIIIPIQIKIDYFKVGGLPQGSYSTYYLNFVNFGHVFLGILMVLILRNVYKNIKVLNKIKNILNWSDKYSYDVYLTHHVFVQSAFACVEYISNRKIAIPLAIILTLLSAMVLYNISNYARNLLESKVHFLQRL